MPPDGVFFIMFHLSIRRATDVPCVLDGKARPIIWNSHARRAQGRARADV